MSAITVMIPTRSRPNYAFKAASSAFDTSDGRAKVVLGIDGDDPCLEEYKQLGFDYEVNWLSGTGNVHALQLIYNLSKTPYVFWAGDDVEFKTQDWDKLLLDAMPKDNMAIVSAMASIDNNQPDHFLLSRDWIEAVGCLIYPNMHHYYVDAVHTEIAKKLGRLIKHPKVLVEHYHYSRHPNGIPEDEIYKRNLALAASDKNLFFSYEAQADIKAAIKRIQKIIQDYDKNTTMV